MASHHSAQGLASLGRHGDSMLVHMSPHDVAGLNYLAKMQGHKLTINPATGLPEAFSLGGFFSSLLPMFAGALTGGMGAPLWAGIAAGAATGAATNKDHLMGAITGGLGGYGGFDLGKGITSMMANPAASTVTNVTPEMLSQGTRNLASSGMNVADPLVQDSFKTALQSATGDPFAGAGTFSNAPMYNSSFGYVRPGPLDASYGVSAINPSGAAAGSNYVQGVNLANTTSLNAQPFEPSMWDKFKQGVTHEGNPMVSDLTAAGKIAMPIGGAVLGGLEPSDIYGEPMKPNGKDKYDPYATLNLSGDTGLRLYAAGGNVNTNTSSISTGGLQDLYGTSDNAGAPQPLSQDGYGIGRLESLTSAGSQAKAADMFYAQGGPVSFADGGDTEGVKLEQLSAPTDAVPSPGGIAALANSAQMGQAPSDVNLAAPPTATDGSIITQVANNLKVDPNYQGKNPIEAAIVKQLKGTDPMQQDQKGLGSLAPAQTSFPMAASYAPTQSMGPTYYAGMNAPGSHMAKGGYLDGQGDGMSDSIPATIEGKQPARLADGEFVVPADVVSHIGNGSSKAGSNRLYAMLDKVRKARTGHTKQGKQINPNKYMPA
jgi:hypothetical protein